MIKINSIINSDLIHYAIARIDIKNSGQEDNNIDIIHCSDEDSSIYFPSWFKQEDGEGVVIQSFKGDLDLKFKCINDGKLIIRLRGIDARDKNGNKIQIFVNFLDVSINGDSLINHEKLVSHDNFYQSDEIYVKNGEIIYLNVKWVPFKVDLVHNSIIFNQLSDNYNLTNFFIPCNNLNKDVSESLISKDFVPKVSIIIPVFNPGDLLYKCLDSVVNQSLKEIEIICVDDGSTDNSLNILEDYSKKDSRFIIFHQNNEGAGIARNKAIKESSGEFIIFLDSDDWIESDMCERLYHHAIRLNSDMVIFNSLWHTPDGINEFNYFSRNDFEEDYNSFTFDYHFILNRLLIASYGVIWSRFYKSSFIKDNNIEFPHHKIYNDVEFCFKTALLAKNIAYYPNHFYHYIKLGQPSLQTSFREGKDELIWFNVLEGLYGILIDLDLIDELRVDFINYSIFYTFEKLKNINLELYYVFLDKTKSFFSMLNPQENELNSIKSLNLTWYTSITISYLPIYNELMFGDLNNVIVRLLEFKLNESKKNLEECSFEKKSIVYNSIRDSFLCFKFNQRILNKLPLDLYDFYSSIMTSKSYHDFGLVNNEIVTRKNSVQEILWQDINNSKNLSDYTIYAGQPGILNTVDNYKELKVLDDNPAVVRVFSPIFLGDLEIIFEVKVTDYANIGISSSEDVLSFAFLRISNHDWLFYRFVRINGVITSYVSTDRINWKTIKLTGNSLKDDECQFQFNCGFSDASDKRIMIRNIQIYKI